MINAERSPYILRLDRSASKAISKLSREDYSRVFDALLILCATGTGDIKALKGFDKGTLRLRVGQMRVYLFVTGFLIEVIDVEQRGEAYTKKSRKSIQQRS